MEEEMDRLFFIANRNGYGAAFDFAKQTLGQYHAAFKDPKHFCHLKEYRQRFLDSIITFERVLEGNIQF